MRRGNPGFERSKAIASSAFSLLAMTACARAAEAVRARSVMGTLLTVTVRAAQESSAGAAAEAVLDEADRWDRILSTYKPESEISRLNAAAPEAVTLSAGAAAALAAALAWAERTRGAFDPTVGPLVRAWGFDGPSPGVPSREELDAALSRVGAARVELQGTRARLPSAGAALDFGAIGKGWALDRALDRLDKGVLEEVKMDFGGQWFFWSRDAGARWPSAVRGREDVFTAPAGSLSTSAQSEKSFVVSGPPYPRHAPDAGRWPMTPGHGYRFGHVLDPRTGWPVRGAESVTVWAPTGEAADVLSTALFVMGPAEGAAWAEREGAAALFVGEDGRVTATRAWRERIR